MTTEEKYLNDEAYDECKIPEGTICTRCKKRKATEIWLERQHDGFRPRQLCLICCLEEQIEYAEEAAARLPGLRETHAKALEEA